MYSRYGKTDSGKLGRAFEPYLTSGITVFGFVVFVGDVCSLAVELDAARGSGESARLCGRTDGGKLGNALEPYLTSGIVEDECVEGDRPPCRAEFDAVNGSVDESRLCGKADFGD